MNRKALFSGILIGLGAAGFLALGGIPGAIIFGFGLICVVLRIAQGPWRSFLRAAGCGLIIDIAVWLYKNKGNILPIVFGVPLFILCGFYHSIADVTYIVAAWTWSPDLLWYYPLIVLGNYAGCNIRRITLPSSS